MKSIVFAASTATIAVLAATTMASVPARAEIEYPWCSITSIGQSGMPACMYSTREQCTAFIGGQAGFCQPNARYVAAAQAQGKRRARR